MYTFSDAYPAVRRHTLLDERKCRSLWDATGALNGVPGDLAELGCYRCGIVRLLAVACPDRTVHAFDTFAGIPRDGYAPDLDGHRPGEWAAGLDECRTYLAGLPNVVLHPGLFPATAAGESFALVHLDADLYESTRAGIEYFWPRLSPGGVLVLDDWQWHYCRGVDRAVEEFDFNGAEMREGAPHQLIVTKRGTRAEVSPDPQAQ